MFWTYTFACWLFKWRCIIRSYIYKYADIFIYRYACINVRNLWEKSDGAINLEFIRMKMFLKAESRRKSSGSEYRKSINKQASGKGF